MIDLTGLNGIEIDRVKKAYEKGKKDALTETIRTIHDSVYQEGFNKGRNSVIDEIVRMMVVYHGYSPMNAVVNEIKAMKVKL